MDRKGGKKGPPKELVEEGWKTTTEKPKT